MTAERPLSAYEKWMVRSNLETIRTTDVTAAEQVAILRGNGYDRVADAVEREAPPTCHWLIQVASGNPEPDFPSDLWKEVECGAPLEINEYGSWRCEAGHEYVTYDDPARGAYDAEQAFIERHEG